MTEEQIQEFEMWLPEAIGELQQELGIPDEVVQGIQNAQSVEEVDSILNSINEQEGGQQIIMGLMQAFDSMNNNNPEQQSQMFKEGGKIDYFVNTFAKGGKCCKKACGGKAEKEKCGGKVESDKCGGKSKSKKCGCGCKTIKAQKGMKTFTKHEFFDGGDPDHDSEYEVRIQRFSNKPLKGYSREFRREVLPAGGLGPEDTTVLKNNNMLDLTPEKWKEINALMDKQGFENDNKKLFNPKSIFKALRVSPYPVGTVVMKCGSKIKK